VIEFLSNSSQAFNVNLEKICWRCKDAEFFTQAVDALRARQIFDHRIWAYSLVTGDAQALGEYLAWNTEFRTAAGPYLSSDVVTLDLHAMRDWHMTEFWPMLNPRAHNSKMPGSAFRDSYYSLLTLLAHKSGSVEDISTEDKFMLCCYLLLRNKVTEAKSLFALINPAEAAEVCQQLFDYLTMYLNFMDQSTDECVATATSYTEQLLPASSKAKWEEVLDQLAHKEDPSLGDPVFLEEQEAARIAASEPALNFDIMEGSHSILVKYRNISQISINFYITDLEFLFSSHPFQESNTSYKLILPNDQIILDLPETDGEMEVLQIELPNSLRGKNTIIEIISAEAEVETVKLYNDNSLDVQVAEEEGEIRVLHARTQQPVQQAYCKVYAQNLMSDKKEFFKDGYTDIRGRFDYRTLSTDQLRQTKRIAILISTEESGSVIKEVAVPLSFISQNMLPGF